MNTPDPALQETGQFQIEQAIFTSATSAKSEGYHLVAASSGVSEPDRRELSIWGPSHDSLLEAGHGALSVNFHPLPSGSFCVSQTTLEGTEYSGRGPQVYTHSLIVPPIVMDQFGNNPFVLLREATAAGHVRIYNEPPERLKRFSVQGSFPAVDEELLTQLAGKFGAARLARLIDTVLTSRCLGIVSHESGPRLISGLINCLPLEIRPTISFSTALKHSPRRPFRVLCVPTEEKEQRRLVRQYELDLFHVDQYPEEEPEHPWAQLVLQRFENCEFARFSSELNRPRPRLTVDDLTDLANDLIAGTDSREYSGPIESTFDQEWEQEATSESHDATTNTTEPANEAESTHDDLPTAKADDFAEQADEEPASQDIQVQAPTIEPQPEETPEPDANPFAELESAFESEIDDSSQPETEFAAFEDPFAELVDSTSTNGEATDEDIQTLSTNSSGEPMSQKTPSTPTFQEETAFTGGEGFATTRREPKPAFQLSRQCPEAAARLMRLEATVFEAMTGDESAQGQLGPLWSEVQEKLGGELRQKCREEFLHYAIHMWQHFSTDVDRNPLQAAAALDVVCRLFEEPEQALQTANA